MQKTHTNHFFICDKMAIKNDTTLMTININITHFYLIVK